MVDLPASSALDSDTALTLSCVLFDSSRCLFPLLLLLLLLLLVLSLPLRLPRIGFMVPIDCATLAYFDWANQSEAAQQHIVELQLGKAQTTLEYFSKVQPLFTRQF